MTLVNVAVYENAEPDTNSDGVKTTEPWRYFTSDNVPGGHGGPGAAVVVGAPIEVTGGGARPCAVAGIGIGGAVVKVTRRRVVVVRRDVVVEVVACASADRPARCEP